MSWDWKKALSVGEDIQGTLLRTSTGARQAGGAVARQVLPGGTERLASISWRSGGVGSAWMFGNSVALVEECEHECVFCRGRGEISGGSVCPICNGNKTVHVEPPSVPCAFCGGRGQMPPRSNLSCWVCKGRGFVSVTPPIRSCPDCHGRGKKPCESLYCAKCRGVGVVACTNALSVRI